MATIEAPSNQPQIQEKSPQSKFLDKIQSSVDKIDKKMKQIQVDGIQAVNKIDLTDPGKQILGLDRFFCNGLIYPNRLNVFKVTLDERERTAWSVDLYFSNKNVYLVISEQVFVIPLPVVEPEFRILSEGEVVIAPSSDIGKITGQFPTFLMVKPFPIISII